MEKSEEVLNRIKESNVKMYGEIQDCCGFHKNYCRCNTPLTDVVIFLKKTLAEKSPVI